MFFFSVALMLVAVAAVVYFGLNFGTDFKGGSLWEVTFAQRPEMAIIQEFLSRRDLGEVSASSLGEQDIIFRMREIDETVHQRLLADLRTDFGEVREKRFSSVGAVIGKELRGKSMVAIAVVLLAVIVYIAFVFRTMSRVLSSWSLGLAAIIALAHDVVIPVGIFAVLGHYQGVEITAIFVAAILTVLGYSVSDTVVVFDRVRENVLRFGSREKFAAIVHNSIMQTLTRSLNTTLTTLLPLVAIYFFGGESLKYFALALIMGIFLGAYSSIFVASPILVWWSGRRS